MPLSTETQQPVVLFLNTRRTELEFAPTFEAAHALGYRVFLITDDTNTETKAQYADQVFTVDTFDAEAVIRLASHIARQNRVAGVLTFSDRDVATVARIAEQLNLPGVPLAAANLSRNKAAMREALSNVPELIPAFRRVTDWESLEQARRVVGFPGVLKPTTGSGSKGIFKVYNANELEQAWKFLIQYTNSGSDKVFKDSGGELVYERLLQGTEHSVEGVVSNGHIHIAGITDKTTTKDFALEVAHEFPSALPADATAKIISLCQKVVSELGLNNCAFHLECFLEPDGSARLVEVAARTGGDFIASHLVSAASGRDFLKDVVRVAVGREVESYAESHPRVARVEKLISQKEGVLRAVKGWPVPSHENGVVATCVERSVGASVELPPKDFMSCVIGAVIGVSTPGARGQLSNKLTEALRGVEIEVGQ